MKSKVAVALLQLWTISVVLSVGALHASTTENTIYNFQGGLDGAGAYNGLLADKQGNLYGVTKQGGTPPGLGVVFEISPSGTTWTESVLYRFRGGSDGAFPWTTLVTDAGGNLYGTTTAGGTGTACGTDGCGTIFELSPPGASGQPWTETVLYSFRGGDDGSLPYGGVAFDATGNLYGTTNTGGRPGFGTVFELSPSSGSGEWTETILHSFRGNGDGGDPLGA